MRERKRRRETKREEGTREREMKGEGRERKKESEAGERETELEGRERILIRCVLMLESIHALICDKETTCEHITVLS